MGCNGCSTRTIGGLPGGCKNNGACKTGGCGKLEVYDWLSNVYYHDEVVEHSIVEVKFKGTRKEYYRNVNNENIEIGDALIVESATTGWDLGYVSLTGELVKLQLKKYKINENGEQVRRVIRIATDADFDKFDEGKGLEQETMIKARILAVQLGLSMKISDVEYQGDRTKATFFYTAEGRVDFRELIKIMAREFRIKIEMRQIGLRQEAGRLGGIGSCGRELCCSTWLTDFHSVPTTAARYQNLFLNPLKLSGQCGRLKCCLNYELDQYVEALKAFPDEHTTIKTEKGIARADKIDILKGIMFFRYEGDASGRLFALEIDKVHLLLEMNQKGIAPSEIEEYQVEDENEVEEIQFRDTVGEESLDRFDARRKNKKKKKRGPGGDRDSQAGAGQRPPQGGGQGQQPQQRQGANPQQGQRPNQPDNRPQNQNQGNRPQGQNPNQQQAQGGRPQNPNQGNRPQNQNPNQQRGDRQVNPNNRQQNPANRQPNPGQQQGQGNSRPQNPNQGNRPQNQNPNPQQARPQNPNQDNRPPQDDKGPQGAEGKDNANNNRQTRNDSRNRNSRGKGNRPPGNRPEGGNNAQGPADNGPKPENN